MDFTLCLLMRAPASTKPGDTGTPYRKGVIKEVRKRHREAFNEYQRSHRAPFLMVKANMEPPRGVVIAHKYSRGSCSALLQGRCR
ncbi:hypothetical protein TNCT_108271 [Trichonephila clavata]|uniref:Uncharacterized protein n=1 Tax=Trichonephila clavata TaxID=2740835 RepID=A0A8X6LXM8_TRICU|nr:hypothetical protein TNCT_108271 [Trichonephila clavata]